MEPRRVLAIGLDGLELTYAERLMADGRLPALAGLRDRAARFRLAYGPAQRTGLAWEHVASGKSPDAGGRWAAVEFDPTTYEAWQEGARFSPWWSGMDRRIVVFDTPYVDLSRAPNTKGVVGWGAHDPGTKSTVAPDDLAADFERRVGAYPAPEWTYGLPWPSAARSQAMGDRLVDALRIRTDAARWLASDRLPDWDLFFAVEGELHGATEGLWHGVDPAHPLHNHRSAKAAERSIEQLYAGMDDMVAALMAAAGDASVVAFTLGGMGSNHSDVASMVLLPELLYRRTFGRPLLALPPEWTADPSGVPDLPEDAVWARTVGACLPPLPGGARQRKGGLRSVARRIVRPIRKALRGSTLASTRGGTRSPGARSGVAWQPAHRYSPHWPSMPAFAVPSYYDGRIRLNLRGRERQGTVDPAHYEQTLTDIESLLRECRNPRTGEPAVAGFERASTSDPLALSGSEVDLQVIWNGVVAAIEHPTLGVVGPVPLRRTGGHTGEHGMAYVAGAGITPGERGVRSAFDVVPTIADLLGAPLPAGTSGTSLL